MDVYAINFNRNNIPTFRGVMDCWILLDEGCAHAAEGLTHVCGSCLDLRFDLAKGCPHADGHIFVHNVWTLDLILAKGYSTPHAYGHIFVHNVWTLGMI